MEFTPKIKQTFLEEIATIKKMLDTLSREITEIETGNALEFISPIITARRIHKDMGHIKEDLKMWQAEDNSYETTGEY